MGGGGGGGGGGGRPPPPRSPSIRLNRPASLPSSLPPPPLRPPPRSSHPAAPPLAQCLAEQIVSFSKVLLADPDAVGTVGSLLEDEGEEASPGAATTAYQCVLSEIVPLLSDLMAAGAQEMGGGGGFAGTAQLTEAASDALVELAALLRADDVGKTVLHAVLCLAHDNEVEENRVVATQLLGSLAPVMGRELCCQFVLPEIVSLADDPAFRVRKAAALRIGALCVVVGEELTVARLLPVYEVLSRDEIWGVRKASP